MLEDPVGHAVPENALEFTHQVASGKFISEVCKKYIFSYKLFTDTLTIQYDEFDKPLPPRICFNLFAKCGKQTKVIWLYHKFTPSLVDLIT